MIVAYEDDGCALVCDKEVLGKNMSKGKRKSTTQRRSYMKVKVSGGKVGKAINLEDVVEADIESIGDKDITYFASIMESHRRFNEEDKVLLAHSWVSQSMQKASQRKVMF